MKTCGRCGKVTDDFAKRTRSKDGLQSTCRPCTKEVNAAYYRATPEKNSARKASKIRMMNEAREYVCEYLLAHPCVDCGETDIVVLEFDHVRGTKIQDVSYLVKGGYSLNKVIEEIQKCDVRCANDHRRVTAQRAGHYRNTRPC